MKYALFALTLTLALLGRVAYGAIAFVDRTSCNLSTPPGIVYYLSNPIDNDCFVNVLLGDQPPGVINAVSLEVSATNRRDLDEINMRLKHNNTDVLIDFWSGWSDFNTCPARDESNLCTSTATLTFTQFNGQESSGPWVLAFGDHDSDDVSRLNYATLRVTVPEPAGGLLVLTGLVALAFSLRRKT